jgi:TIR domain
MKYMYQYDVAFSFAGEDRFYVDKVAKYLENSGIKVFYDIFETIGLWGKDLYTHLDEVYRNKARYCVMFISQHYRRKSWTNHERESAQARAFKENSEYILPVRFDDTEIPGVLPTVGYISLRDLEPDELAELIIKKLDHSSSPRNNLTKSKSIPKKSKTVHTSKHSTNHTVISKANQKIASANNIQPRTRTVSYTQDGINSLPNNKPIIYKILTEGGKNNFTGSAKRGDIHKTLRRHLEYGKNYVPGSRIYMERTNSIDEARKKANEIIKRTKPKYN